MPPRKHRPERPKRQQPAPAPASTNGAPNDNAGDAGEARPSDEGLIEFLAWPPIGAEHVDVLAGDHVVQSRQKAEVVREPAHVAALIGTQCERWAASERRAVRFIVRWSRADRTLASQTLEYGTAAPGGIEMNGSVQAFLAQQQRNGLDQHKLYIESYEMVQESWKAILAIANKRNDALERENAELRERLKKVDDVANDLAIETARAEIEQRGRTADILEKRLLPIAEAVAVQKIREAAAKSVQQPPPAAVVSDVDKQ